MYSFGELKEQTAILAQRSGDTDYVAKIGVWLNLAQRFLFNVYDYYIELQGIYNFTTVVNQEDYPMPNNFDKPIRVYDLTNNKKLSIKTEEEYFDGNIANIADVETGTPDRARLFGVTAITGSIGSSGTTLQVKSSSSSDINSVIVRIEGYINSDKTILDYENITISTSSPTTFVAGTKTFYAITHVSKSDDTTGYITLADSSDETLAILSPTDRVLQHKIMKLGLIPDAANSMRVLYKKKHNKMVNDNDYPFIDADDFLILDGWGWALSQEKETVDKALTVWNKAQSALNAILSNQNTKLGADYQHKLTNMWAQAHRV